MERGWVVGTLIGKEDAGLAKSYPILFPSPTATTAKQIMQMTGILL